MSPHSLARKSAPPRAGRPKQSKSKSVNYGSGVGQGHFAVSMYEPVIRPSHSDGSILNAEDQKLFPTSPNSGADVSLLNTTDLAPDTQREPAGLIEEALAPSVLIFGRRPDSPPGRKPRVEPSVPEQASLF